MYWENKKKGNFIKEFVLKLLLIIIFVLLLIWLVPWPNMNSLNPLKDQIFNANLQTMKEAGITYFTTERLPVEVGDKTTLTLQKMLDMKLLVPFTDRNGNSCDVKASYISLEKKETEYLMKVNLKCGEEEDYIIVHLGCYSYCTTDICEARPNETVKPTNNPKPTKSPNPTKTPIPTKSPDPTKTPEPTKSPDPTKTPEPTKSPDPTKTPEPTKTPVPTPTPTPVAKQCEYKKEIPAQYGAWTLGQEQMKKKNEVLVFGEGNTKRVVDLGIRRIAVGIKDAVYKNVYVEQMQTIKAGTVTHKLCTNYTYVADVNTTYRVLSDWTYTNEYKYGYNGDMPDDTLDSKWVLQSVDWNHCEGDCVNNPYGIYRHMVRKIEKITDFSNVSATCTEIVDKTVDVYITVPVGRWESFEVEPEQTLYGNVQFYRVDTRTYTPATTDYLWQDCSLAAPAGYTFTGKTR